MATRKIAIVLIALISLFYAVPMLEPFQKEISDGDVVYLGEIGPGQTISISIDGRPKTGGIYGIGGTYDMATVTGLPQRWEAQDSDWAGVPLQVKITADKSAREGEYTARINVLDDGDKEKLGNITFTAKVNITYDVLSASLDGSTKEVLSGQPARFYITVTNKANTGDAFSVSSSNVRGWAFKKYVYVPAQSSRVIYYEVASAEEAEYFPSIEVVSQSSSLINETLNATVKISPTLGADFKAVNNGMLFFPAMSGIIYSLAGLISNIF